MFGRKNAVDSTAKKRKTRKGTATAPATKLFVVESAAIATSPPAPSVQNDGLSPAIIKIEISDSESEETHEVDEYILDDIKPEIYKVQPQYLEQQQTAATLPPLTNVIEIQQQWLETQPTEAVELPPLKIECDDDVQRSVDIRSPNEIIDNNHRNSKSLQFLEIDDMQQTDSDEDGYSDIDLDDDDYQVLDGCEMPDPYDPEWCDSTTMLRKALPTFEKPIQASPLQSHIYFFKTILDDWKNSFFNKVAECCNQRAVQTHYTTLNSNFEACTGRDVSIFFGICLQMGSMQLTTLNEYWESETSYNGFDGFSSKMSFERFQTILELLNFQSFYYEDNTSSNTNINDDIFIELQPLLNFFNKRMQTVHKCSQNLVLNEPIIYWKGKLNLLNDMNEKFGGNAIMLHHLSEQSGLVLKVVAKREEAERRKEANSNSKDLALERLYKAILLLKEKCGKGHTAYISKYYSSYALCMELLNLGTFSSGILDSKRFGNSRELVLKNLRDLEFTMKFSENIMMLKTCRKRKNSYFFSSDCLAVLPGEMKRHGRLKLVKEINWHLRATEMRLYILHYQLALERYEIAWDKRLMIFVMNIIVFNSFILYKLQNPRAYSPHPDNISYQQFRQKIIKFLLLHPKDWRYIDNKNICVNEKRKIQINVGTESLPKLREASSAQLKLEKKYHLPKTIKCSKEKLVKKRCAVCCKAGLLNFSQLCCDSCPGMPGLCEKPCFKIWHS